MTGGEIEVELVRPDGRPLPVAGVLLDIKFYVGGRFRYQFILGRTEADGVCRTSFQEIERELESNRRLFLMDYNTPLAECDDTVGISSPSASEIADRVASRAKWWPASSSPYEGVANQLVRSSEQKFKLDPEAANAIMLVCEPNADR